MNKLKSSRFWDMYVACRNIWKRVAFTFDPGIEVKNGSIYMVSNNTKEDSK